MRKAIGIKDYIIFSKTKSDKPLNTCSNTTACSWKKTGRINTLVISGRRESIWR